MMDTGKPAYTHEERVKLVQHAAESYYQKQTGTPSPLNRSFINREKEAAKRGGRIKRYSFIAAAALLVILVGSTISMIAFDDSAYGDKGLLHRIYKSATGLDTDQQDEAVLEQEVAQPVASRTIESMDDIGEAIDFAEGTLYVPQYIPEGYQLETLTVEQSQFGDYTAEYTFKNKEKQLALSEISISDDDSTVSADGDGDLIKLKDRVLYVQGEDSNGDRWIDIFTEDSMMQMCGKFSREEGIKFAKELKRCP